MVVRIMPMNGQLVEKWNVCSDCCNEFGVRVYGYSAQVLRTLIRKAILEEVLVKLTNANNYRIGRTKKHREVARRKLRRIKKTRTEKERIKEKKCE